MLWVTAIMLVFSIITAKPDMPMWALLLLFNYCALKMNQYKLARDIKLLGHPKEDTQKSKIDALLHYLPLSRDT